MALIILLLLVIILFVGIRWFDSHGQPRYICISCHATLRRPKKVLRGGWYRSVLLLVSFFVSIYIATLVPVLWVLPLLILFFDRGIRNAMLRSRCPVCGSEGCVIPLVKRNHSQTEQNCNLDKRKLQKNSFVDWAVKGVMIVLASIVVFVGVLVSGICLIGVEHGGIIVLFVVIPVMYLLFRIPMRIFVRRLFVDGKLIISSKNALVSIALFVGIVTISGLAASYLITQKSSMLCKRAVQTDTKTQSEINQ